MLRFESQHRFLHLLNTVVGTDTDSFLVCTDSDNTNVSITDLLLEINSRNLFGFYLILELYYEITSTGKVNTLRQTTDKE